MVKVDDTKSNDTKTTKTTKKPKKHRGLKAAALGSLVIVALYIIAVFSNIPFIVKWRTIYIETAMSTMTHQWLATAFIPSSVIDEVTANTKKQFEENIVDSSNIAVVKPVEEPKEPPKPEISPEELARQSFEQKYYEIDVTTMPKDIDYSSIQISNILDLGIKTTAGDSVWAIDTINNLMIIEVKGDGYVGKLAIVKDSSQVYLHNNTNSGRGSTVTEHCEEGNAILGINASGFIDYEGKGNGKTPVGLVISESKFINRSYGATNYQIAGFDNDDNFIVGKNVDTSILRDAIQFYPIIVLNGEKHATGSYGLGIQPRSAIGQTADKSTLMLIVDGRQIGYSVGTTVSECADIMLRYGAYNAMNMDGGSSASMSYNGEMITRTSSPMKQGRYLPDAWVVKEIGNGDMEA